MLINAQNLLNIRKGATAKSGLLKPVEPHSHDICHKTHCQGLWKTPLLKQVTAFLEVTTGYHMMMIDVEQYIHCTKFVG